MPNVLSRIRADVGAQQQLVALLLVAGCLITFEMILFFKVIVPGVKESLHGMLGDIARSVRPDRPQEALGDRALAAGLGFLDAREAQLVRNRNRNATINGILIIVAALALALAVFALGTNLRRAPKKPVVWDVLLTLGLLVIFQIFFYFFGKQWQYTSADEQLVLVADAYDPDGEALRNVQATLPEALEPGRDLSAVLKGRLRRLAQDLAADAVGRVDPDTRRKVLHGALFLYRSQRVDRVQARELVAAAAAGRFPPEAVDLLLEADAGTASEVVDVVLGVLATTPTARRGEALLVEAVRNDPRRLLVLPTTDDEAVVRVVATAWGLERLRALVGPAAYARIAAVLAQGNETIHSLVNMDADTRAGLVRVAFADPRFVALRDRVLQPDVALAASWAAHPTGV